MRKIFLFLVMICENEKLIFNKVKNYENHAAKKNLQSECFYSEL